MALVLRLMGRTGELISGKLAVRRGGSHSTRGSRNLNRYSSSIPSAVRTIAPLSHVKVWWQAESSTPVKVRVFRQNCGPRHMSTSLKPKAPKRPSSAQFLASGPQISVDVAGEVGRPGSQDCAPCSCVDSLACSSSHPPTSVLLPLDHQPLPSLSMLSDWVMSTRATKATSWHMATSPYGSS